MLTLGFKIGAAAPAIETSEHLGTVMPGTTSDVLAFEVVNTGDGDLPAPIAWVEQASTLDGDFQVTIAGVSITGTSEATATVLPALAVGASHPATARCVNPAGEAVRPVLDGAKLKVKAAAAV